MSRLREEIERARAEYRAERYPGDLADVIARRPTGGGRRWRRVAAVAAVLLAAAVLSWHYRPGPEADPAPSATAAVDPQPKAKAPTRPSPRRLLRGLPRVTLAAAVKSSRASKHLKQSAARRLTRTKRATLRETVKNTDLSTLFRRSKDAS